MMNQIGTSREADKNLRRSLASTRHFWFRIQPSYLHGMLRTLVEAYETSWITSREDGKDYISATKPGDHPFLSKVGFITWNKDEKCLQLKLQWNLKYLIIGATIRVYWKLEDARVVKPHLPEDIFYHFLECKRVSHKVLRPLENLKDLTHRWAGKWLQGSEVYNSQELAKRVMSQGQTHHTLLNKMDLQKLWTRYHHPVHGKTCNILRMTPVSPPWVSFSFFPIKKWWNPWRKTNVYSFKFHWFSHV